MGEFLLKCQLQSEISLCTYQNSKDNKNYRIFIIRVFNFNAAIVIVIYLLHSLHTGKVTHSISTKISILNKYKTVKMGGINFISDKLLSLNVTKNKNVVALLRLVSTVTCLLFLSMSWVEAAPAKKNENGQAMVS